MGKVIKIIFTVKILFLISVFLIWSNLYAYSPTIQEISLLGKVNSTFAKQIKKDFSYKSKILKNISNLQKLNTNERTAFFLSWVYSYISSYKLVNESPIINNSFKKDFLEKYWKDILWNKNIDSRCIDNYEFVDKIAQKQDFPTELILAIWKMETNCNLHNPNNWYWLFQMTSFYFKPWWISKEQAQEQVYRMISVAKNKIKYYERKTKKKINISYSNYDLWSIQMFAWLYVWNRQKISPTKSLYANWNINQKMKYKVDWIVTSLIKVLYTKIK